MGAHYDPREHRKKFAKSLREEVFKKTGGHCAYCGAEITPQTMQVDHVVPLEFYETYAAFGEDLNDIHNLMPACRSCNNYKSTLTVEKFRDLIERGPQILARDSVTYRAALRFGTVEPKPGPVVFYFERGAAQ